MPGPIRLLRFCDRPAGGALITGEPQRHQTLVNHVGADAPAGAFDQLLDLLHERVDQPGPAALGQRIGASSRNVT
jgi:hypothetical protein